MGKGVLQRTDAESQLSYIATELLSESQRRSIHQVCATDLHNIGHFLCLLIECLLELTQTWKSDFDYLLVACDVHTCWEGIVGGLRLIDVIIREESLLSFADLLACELVCAVSDDFVDVHVALRT